MISHDRDSKKKRNVNCYAYELILTIRLIPHKRFKIAYNEVQKLNMHMYDSANYIFPPLDIAFYGFKIFIY